MYKAYVDAAKHIETLYYAKRTRFVRDGYTLLEPIFNPPKHITVEAMKDLFQGVLKELEPIARLPQTVLLRTINIRETISTIRDRLVEHGTTSFHSLLKQAKNKSEAIITFLAVLELVKQRSATVSQSALHEDMQIEYLQQNDSSTENALV
jgi:chromatin segregation and condensation protein Rec8/ScpA/Scc1 (kleisin family)